MDLTWQFATLQKNAVIIVGPCDTWYHPFAAASKQTKWQLGKWLQVFSQVLNKKLRHDIHCELVLFVMTTMKTHLAALAFVKNRFFDRVIF